MHWYSGRSTDRSHDDAGQDEKLLPNPSLKKVGWYAEADSGSNAGRFAKTAAAELVTWNNLLEVARRAAELNAGNGYRVNQHRAHVDRAMEAPSRPRPGLYSTGGVTAYSSGASRSLAQG